MFTTQKYTGYKCFSCTRTGSNSALSVSACLSLCVSLGEALGAIGDPTVLDLLKEYSQDPVIEVGT